MVNYANDMSKEVFEEMKRSKGQTTIYNALHRKLKIEQHEAH